MDIAVLVLIIAYVFSGYKEGFVYKLVSFIASILSGFVLWFLSGPIGQVIQIYPKDGLENDFSVLLGYDLLNRIFVFVALFLVIQILFIFLKPIAKWFQKIPIIGFVNRILGMVFGFAQSMIVLIVITMLLSLPLVENGKQLIEGSSLKHLQPVTTYIFESVNQMVIDEAINSLNQ